MISLSLAIINLFPFLPLDGGHIFWAWSRSSAAPGALRRYGAGGRVGFMLVIVLFMLGLTNDIDRLTGEGFDVR